MNCETMTTEVQTQSSAAPSLLPELPFIEGVSLCASHRAKLKMVSLSELNDDEVAYATYEQLFNSIRYRLNCLKDDTPADPESYIRDMQEFENLMQQVNVIRRIYGLQEVPSYNISDHKRFYKGYVDLPKEMNWQIKSDVIGRFRRSDGSIVLVLDTFAIVPEKEYLVTKRKDTVASYARAMQSSIESVDKYALWVEDQERAEAKQRLEDTLNRILETYPAAEVECDGCCEECDV